MHVGAAALKPRKSPVQTRSALTVDALHAATIQVLIREGLARCTTTRIAERAGTSVGTLYQYYPNRDALLCAVLERHLEAIAAEVERTCREHRNRTVGEMASALVTAFLAAKLSDPNQARARALYAVSEERDGAALADRMHSRIIAAVAAMLSTARDAAFDDPAIVASVALQALVGPVLALLKRQAKPGSWDRIQDELILLVTAYFQTYRAESVPPRKQAGRARR